MFNNNIKASYIHRIILSLNDFCGLIKCDNVINVAQWFFKQCQVMRGVNLVEIEYLMPLSSVLTIKVILIMSRTNINAWVYMR